MRLALRRTGTHTGWLMGHSFLDFTHVGRNTEQPHEAVAMVLRYDDMTGEGVTCAA